jgi:CRP-like cAMP-binding protein
MPSPTMMGYPVDSRFANKPISRTVRLEALRHVGLFKGVSKRALGQIDQVSEVRTALKGDIIVAQGERGADAMVVLEGSAAVSRGKRRLGVVTVGQVFGEMALLDDQPRSATVTALEPMRMLVINGRSFRKLMTTVPGLSDALLATLSMRLREANAAAEL